VTGGTREDLERDALETLEADIALWEAVRSQHRPRDLMTWKGRRRVGRD
jgi:hypothetical protein